MTRGGKYSGRILIWTVGCIIGPDFRRRRAVSRAGPGVKDAGTWRRKKGWPGCCCGYLGRICIRDSCFVRVAVEVAMVLVFKKQVVGGSNNVTN